MWILCGLNAIFFMTQSNGAIESDGYYNDYKKFGGYSHMTPLMREALHSGALLSPYKEWEYRVDYLSNQQNFVNKKKIPIGDVRNESELIRRLSAFCEDDVTEKIEQRQLGYYGTSFDTVADCVQHRTHSVLQSAWNNLLGRDQAHYDFHPIVHIPPEEGCLKNWLWDLPIYQVSVFSQGGQDGILNRIFEIIGVTNQFYVEIGYNNKEWVNGSNTYFLHNLGWNGLLIDGQFHNPAINLHQHFVTPDNIAKILSSHSVPSNPDYVSIDIDSLDLWVAESMLLSYRPRVISVEYNCHLPIGATVAQIPNDPTNVKPVTDLGYGASAGAVRNMLNKAGYEVVMLVSLLDVVAIRRDLLNGACPLPFASFSNQVQFMHRCVIETEGREEGIDYNMWVEYNTWISTKGNVQKSKRAALVQMLEMQFPTSGAMGSLRCLGFL